MPALANLTGDSGLDIVVANYTNLEILDAAARSVAYRVTDATATFYPSAVVTRGNANAPASIFVSGWLNSAVYRFNTLPGDPMPTQAWSTYMGAPSRTGVR